MVQALGGELRLLWRLRGLLLVVTRRELSARFAGSAGGLLWAWLPPLMTIAAYYLSLTWCLACVWARGRPQGAWALI